MSELRLQQRFDPQRKRHYLNDQLTVLHCHHYATLFTQLSLDAKDLVDGTKILKETTEDIFYKVLSNYYQNNNITDPTDRIEIGRQMFSAVGMGKMVVISSNENGGEVEMPVAYVDEGWVKKWGKYKEPVNFIGMGYVAGMFAAAFGKPTRMYNITETQSRVMGADKSVFRVSI